MCDATARWTWLHSERLNKGTGVDCVWAVGFGRTMLQCCCVDLSGRCAALEMETRESAEPSGESESESKRRYQHSPHEHFE